MSLAVIAGIGAAAAYIDAKTHIRKDIRSLRGLKNSEKAFTEAVKAGKPSLWDLFETNVAKLPESQECIWSRKGRYTWRETHALACNYAQLLLSLGVTSHQLVAFYLQNSPEFVAAWLATWSIGTAPAMINHSLGGDALMHCLKVGDAKVMLVDEEGALRARVEEVRARIEGELGMKIVVLDAEMKRRIAGLGAGAPDPELRRAVKGSDAIMLLFTSGTTGFPKGSKFILQRAWASAGERCYALGVTSKDRWYDPMPMYHGTGGMVVVSCLTSGITLCVGKKFSGSQFWSDIRDSEATVFVYVGEAVRYLMAAPPSPLDRQHSVRVMFGNGLRPDVWEKFRRRFGVETVSEFFNSTEGVFSLLNVNRGDFSSTAVGHHGALIRMLTRNIIIPVEIDHETNAIKRDPRTGWAKRKSYDEGGEIIMAVESRDIFAGYHKSPEATAKRFATDVFKKGDLYWRTGDALRRDTDGRWYFLDRLGDTYRWKSENVSTAEVASVIGAYPGILEANVYGVLVPSHDGRAGCAAITLDPSTYTHPSTFPFASLLAHMRSKLPKYAVPVFLRVQSEMKSMHNMKQNKTVLRGEGVDLGAVKAGEQGGDVFYWCGGGSEVTYRPFGEGELEGLRGGGVRL